MEEERFARMKTGISKVPTVLIEGKEYEGMINHNMLREAICEKLSIKPKICVP